ncbi:MAG: hypothetical protein UZ21_OP11001000917 [Microgenomates bacterium OLB22]|nr:MAG: hypothetical protein UZ21_OP11001000917 [Microgenomates bacterium OLB22]
MFWYPEKSFFFLPQHLYDSSDVIGVKVLARNDGKHRYTIKGHLEISSGIGKKDIHTFVEEEILANSTRLVRASDSAQLECNRSSVKNICRNGPFSALLQSFSIGKKEITAVLTLDGQTISTLKVTAVLFPLKLMCGIVLLLTAVIILSLAFSKKQISADTPSDRLSK